MIQEWFDKRIFLYIILGICSLGFLIKFILSMKYRMLIRASKKMGTSKNRLMRVLRLKFETCYKLKIGVNNVDTFVDKYVYRYRFCGLLLYTWETISGELIILSVLSGSVFSILGLLEECGINDILSTLIAGVLGALVLISYDHFINLNTKRKVLKVNIRDYLENFLKSRLENGEFSSDLLEQYKKEYLELPNKKNKHSADKDSNPGFVAHVESAATEVVLIPSKEQQEEAVKPAMEEEFNDAQLFVEAKKDSPVTVVKAESKKEEKDKHKAKKKLKPEEEAQLRRQAKKDELKKMILEDKETRRRTMPEFFPETTVAVKDGMGVMTEPVGKSKGYSKPEPTVNSEMFRRPDGKEKAEQSVKPGEMKGAASPFSRPTEIKKETKLAETKKSKPGDEKAIDKKSISSEEAQIIEDILREYLA